MTTTMALDRPPQACPLQVSLPRLWAFVQDVTERPQLTRNDLPELLNEFTRLLGARGAGLCLLIEGEPAEDFRPEKVRVSPWQRDPKFLTQLPAGDGLVQTADQWITWLPVHVQSPEWLWAFWLDDEPGLHRSAAERGVVSMTGWALYRQLQTSSDAGCWSSWQDCLQRRQRLEEVRPIVDRLIHDFNNVLTTVQGFTELSLQDLPKTDPVRRNLAEVFQAAQQASEINRQISCFTRRSVPRGMSLEPELALQQEVEAKQAEFVKRRIGIVWQTNAKMAPLTITDEGLRLVTRLLLNNAAEAIVGEGLIRVSAQSVDLSRAEALAITGPLRPGRHLRVTISDNGPGFSPEARSKFLHGPFTATRSRNRRGLGLAMAYGVLAHGRGGLSLDETSSKGADMSFYVPYA